MKKYPFFTKAVVPKGAYKGVEQDMPTVAVMAILVARAEMEEAMAYQITKAIFDNLKDIELQYMLYLSEVDSDLQ